MTRTVDIDVDVSFGVDAAADKKVESDYCEQDDNDDRYGSHTTARIFSHNSSLPGLTAEKPSV